MSAKRVTRRAKSGRIVETVVAAVAEANGVRPEHVTTPLYTVVDTDALERLFSPQYGGQARAGRVSLAIEGCTVIIESDGLVTVVPDRGITDRNPERVSD